MKKSVKVLSLLALLVMLVGVFAGCRETLSLQEYVEMPTVKKEIEDANKEQMEQYGDVYQNIQTYVESETKLVYDFQYSESVDLDVTYMQTMIEDPSLEEEFKPILKKLRDAINNQDVTIIARYRNYQGSVIAEKEFTKS